MTIDPRRVCAGLAVMLLACAALLVHGCAGTNRLRHGDTLDVSGYPPDIQAAYRVFAVRCSRCHTLARPLNADIHDPQQWVRYVARMRRNPTSGINEKDAETILRFLLYYMHQREETERHDQEDPELVVPPEPPKAIDSAPAGPASSSPPSPTEPPREGVPAAREPPATMIAPTEAPSTSNAADPSPVAGGIEPPVAPQVNP